MIILDWNKNSEEVLAQGHYNTKRSVNTEQTHLCQYWQEQGVGKDEAFKIWISLESPQVIGSFNLEEKREYFDSFWNKGLNEGFNIKYIYGLTEREYCFINQLDVDLEYKCLLRTFIEYCRSYGEGDSFFCRQPIYNAIVKGERQRITEAREIKMSEWNRKYSLYEVFSYSGYTTQTTVNKVVLHYIDIDSTPSCFSDFTQRQGVCSQCGKKFISSEYRKTDLCPQCYCQKRHLAFNKKYYSTHKAQNVRHFINTDL